MGKLVLKNSLVLANGIKISTDLNSISLDSSSDMVEDTTLEKKTRTMKTGLKTIALSTEGYVGDTDEDISVNFGVDNRYITIAPDNTIDSVAYSYKASISEYNPIKGAIGEMNNFSLSAGANSDLVRGKIIPIDATLSGETLEIILPTPTAKQELYGVLHVYDAEGTLPTLDVDIESDDNSSFTSPTIRLTFNQITSQGVDFKASNFDTTDTYYRAKFAIGGATPEFKGYVFLGFRNTQDISYLFEDGVGFLFEDGTQFIFN